MTFGTILQSIAYAFGVTLVVFVLYYFYRQFTQFLFVVLMLIGGFVARGIADEFELDPLRATFLGGLWAGTAAIPLLLIQALIAVEKRLDKLAPRETVDDKSQMDMSEPSPCLHCRSTIPAGRDTCPTCGWSYQK